MLRTQQMPKQGFKDWVLRLRGLGANLRSKALSGCFVVWGLSELLKGSAS